MPRRGVIQRQLVESSAAPDSAVFEIFADKVETAMQEAARRFEVDLSSPGPAGNADPIRR